MSIQKKRKFSISNEQEINDGIAEINRNMMFNKLANEYYRERNTEYEIKTLKLNYEEVLYEIGNLKKKIKNQDEEMIKLKRLLKKLVKKYDNLYDNEKSKKDLEFQEIKDLFDELYLEKKNNEEYLENINKSSEVESEKQINFSSSYIS